MFVGDLTIMVNSELNHKAIAYDDIGCNGLFEKIREKIRSASETK